MYPFKLSFFVEFQFFFFFACSTQHDVIMLNGDALGLKFIFIKSEWNVMLSKWRSSMAFFQNLFTHCQYLLGKNIKIELLNQISMKFP